MLIIPTKTAAEPPDDYPPELPTNFDFEDGSPRCGICGEKKIKLPMKTRYGSDVWVCDNIPEGERLRCDGLAYRNATLNYREMMQDD